MLEWILSECTFDAGSRWLSPKSALRRQAVKTCRVRFLTLSITRSGWSREKDCGEFGGRYCAFVDEADLLRRPAKSVTPLSKYSGGMATSPEFVDDSRSMGWNVTPVNVVYIRHAQ